MEYLMIFDSYVELRRCWDHVLKKIKESKCEDSVRYIFNGNNAIEDIGSDDRLMFVINDYRQIWRGRRADYLYTDDFDICLYFKNAVNMYKDDLIESFMSKVTLHKEPVGRISITKRYPKIKDVKFRKPAVIVFWDDNTKTVVRTQGKDKWDPEKGLAMAISRKMLGNNRDYYNTFIHWLKKAK